VSESAAQHLDTNCLFTKSVADSLDRFVSSLTVHHINLHTYPIDKKAQILECAREINTIRIETVHKLTKQTSLVELDPMVSKLKEKYEDLYMYFESAHDWFCLCFNDFRKDWEDEPSEES